MGNSVDAAFAAYQRRQDEEEEKRQERQGSIDAAYNAWVQRTISVVDDDYINSFIQDTNSFLSQAQTDWDALSWESGTNNDTNKTRRETWKEINDRLGILRIYASTNKEGMGEEAYNNLVSYLDQVERGGSGVVGRFNNAYNYYSQWESQEHYDVSNMSVEDYKLKLDGIEDAENDLDIIWQVNQTTIPIDGYGDNATEEQKQKHQDYMNKLTTLWEKYGKDQYDSVEAFYYGEFYTDAGVRVSQQAENRASPVAYTTKDGANLTWQDLYDKSVSNRDTQQKYDLYSSKDGWSGDDAALVDRHNDFVIVSNLAKTAAYDWEYAQQAGIDEETYKQIEADRAYISEKYGVDLSDPTKNAQIINDLMNNQLRPFEYMDQMNDQEKAILSYVYENKGYDAALEWHNSRTDIYAERERADIAAKWTAFGEEHPLWGFVAARGLNLVSGVEYLTDIFNYMATGEAQYNTTGMMASSSDAGVMERTDWEIGNWDAYDFVYSTVSSGVDSGLSMAVFGSLGGLALGMQAAAKATNDALDRGMSSKQAFWNGVAAGVFELAFESISIGNFKALQEIPAATWKDMAWNVGKSMLVNATEETATEVANITYDLIVNGDLSQYETAIRQHMANGYSEEDAKHMAAQELSRQVVESAASGALMGFGFGAVGSAGTAFNNAKASYNAAQQTKAIAEGTLSVDGGTDALINLANEVAGVSSPRMQNRLINLSSNVKNKATTRNVGQLYRAVGKANNAQDKADIVKSLERQNVDSKTANALAEAITTVARGDQISIKQQKLLADYSGYAPVQTALENIVLNDRSTMGQRRQSLGNFSQTAALSKMAEDQKARAVKEAKKGSKADVDAAAKDLPESNFNVSNLDGKTIDSKGNEIVITGVESIKDGKMILKTENGTIDASEVSYASSDEALVYSVVADMGVSAESAWNLIKNFKASDGVSAQTYASFIPLAYKYGRLNYKVGLENIDTLTIEQKERAFIYGRNDADAEAKALIKKTSAKPSETAVSEKFAKKEIIFEGFNYDEKTARPMQKASMAAIDVINKMSNLEVHVFQSVKKNGKYYAEVNGVFRAAPNGYFTDGNKIYIDINAGNHGQGAMLFTMAHEIGHYIAQWNAEDFKAISDFLFSHYGKGVPVYKLLEDQKQKLIKNYKADGKAIPRNYVLERQAQEELVCDMLSNMFVDERAFDVLTELKQKNLNLFQKLGQAIKKLLDKLKKLLKVYDNQSPDFQYAASNELIGKKAFEQLQDLYMRAFVKADENYQSAEKNTTEDGGENKYSDRYLNANENAEILSMIDKVTGKEFKANEKVFLGIVSDSVAEDINNLTGVRVNGFKVAIEARQIEHIIKDHGANGLTDHSMENPSDIAKMEFALGSPDYIRKAGKTQAYTYMRNGKNRTADTVLYEKSIGDKSYYVIQAVPDAKAKTLYIVTAFIGKNGYKKEASQLINAKGPDATAKTDSVVASNNNIRNTEPNVNKKLSERISDDALSHFGRTYSWKETGYLLTNGAKLDFSGRHEGASGGYRTVDHRDILNVYPEDTELDGNEAMVDFMRQGNIRIMPESDGINLQVKPTKTQENALDDFISKARGEVIVDIDDENGNTVVSVEYTKGTRASKVLQDIRNYFDNGAIPSVSTASQFHTMFSNRDLTEDPLYPDTGRERSAFNRTYIDKTNDLKRTKERDIIINTHLYVYYVRAIGRSYNSQPFLGEILKKVPIDTAVNVDDVREEVINGTYSATKEDYIPYEETPYVRGRNDGRAPSLRERLAAEGYDYLLDEPYEGDTKGNRRQGDTDQQIDEVKQSTRDSDSVSNRSLLANAFEGVAQNEIEKQKVQEYKSKIELLDAQEQKLAELNAQIKELSFAEGKRDIAKIRQLREEAIKTANRISTYDKQLLRLEASKPLQDVLAREKRKAYQRAEQKGKEALAEYKVRAEAKLQATTEKWRESRKKGIDSRHRTAMRHKIKDIVNELNQYLLRGTKDRHVPIELQKAVAEALDAVNMDTVGAEERIAKLQAELVKAKTPEQIQEISRKIDHIYEMGDRMNGRLQKLKDAYDQFINSDDPLIANSHDEVISNKLQSVIDTIGDTPLRDMTLAQLEDVYDMYKMVLTTIRNANKAFNAKKSESISAIANQVMAEVEKVGGKKNLQLKNLSGIKNFSWNNLKPVYAFERIGSSAFTEVYNNVRSGEDIWATDVSEAREYYLDKSKKYGYDSWDFKKRYKFESTSGMEFELSLEQIMSLYAFSKREQAAEHLKKGGIVFDETTEVTMKSKLGIPLKFNPTEATAYNLSVEILDDIVSKLSKEQKGFVDEMQEYLSATMGAKGNEVSLALYGIKLFKEKFYFPLKSATQFMAKAKEQQQGDVKVKNKGFSKETVVKASNPIVLTPFMDVWADHVNEMSMYHSFVLPLEDFYRVYNYKTPTSETMATESVEMFIQNAYGKAATKYIDQLLKDLNGGAMADPRENIGKVMTAKFKKAKVFASMSVVIQQPSAIGRAFALVSPKYFRPTKDGMNHKQLWNELKKYAPVAIIKEMGYFDTNMGRSTRDFIKAKEHDKFVDIVKRLDVKGLGSNTKDFVLDSGYRDDVLSRLPALADEVTWCAIWNAVKRETVSTHKDLRPGSEEFLKAAGERFTEVVTKTQVYDSVLARSANMRSKSGMMSMMTAFMAEPTTAINMLEDAIIKAKRGDKRYAGRAFASVMTSIILNNALVSIIYAMRDDDEEETFLEKYLNAFVSGMIDDINPITYYPYLKDLWSLFQGYDVERSDVSLFSEFFDSGKALVKAYTSEDGDVGGAWWDFTGTVANMFGIPMENIRREINGAINTIKTLITDFSGRQTTLGSLGDTLQATVKNAIPVLGWLPGETKGDKLYDAIINGDTAYVERLKGGYKDEKAYTNAIRKALRENDPRIHDAAVARMNGDLDEYTRIVKEIIAEKHFTQDDIVAAINAEINALDKGETTSSEPKAKGLYTADDFVVAISQGDFAMANAVKSDIIETAQKNGKTQEEAENGFVSSATTALKEMYLSGEISENQVIKALMEYCDRTESEAYAGIRYWDFKQDYPDVYVNDAWIEEYYDEVAGCGIDLKVFVDYRNQVKNITGEGKKERRMEIIDSLPISNAQKDALYYAEGWAASKLYEAPWH